jgi:hypothetical protein
MEKMKQEFVEKESSLLQEIERLELANEQLIQGAPDSDLQQLQVEVSEFGKFLYSASLVIKNGWLYRPIDSSYQKYHEVCTTQFLWIDTELFCAFLV